MNIAEDLSTSELRKRQLQRLNQLLLEVRQRPFYSAHLGAVELPLDSLEHLDRLPLLTKSDIVGTAKSPVGRMFDLPRDEYVRLHQTSGTQGFPMAVLDTQDDWNWFLDCWDFVLQTAKVTSSDVVMMAFSFGPFIGFWPAVDALIRRGALVVPGGGMPTEVRLQMIIDHRCSIVCCTPTYALRLAAVAQTSGIDLAASSVTRVIVAGEPGGSVPSVRSRIEQAWGASLIDHSGASEVGAWGFGSEDGRGIHVVESEFIAEIRRFDEQHPAGTPVPEGGEGELVLTGLGRRGGPVIRYRTGDIVRGFRDHQYACPFLWLEGGVIGRADDMLVVRGVNIFPSSIEAIVREVAADAEFRMIASRREEMDQLELEIETDEQTAARLSHLLQTRLAIRVPVTTVPTESLPRFEAKARRLIDKRR